MFEKRLLPLGAPTRFAAPCPPPPTPPSARLLVGDTQLTRHFSNTHLRDRFGRTLDYLRLALTDRCTLRCRYCMPADGINFLGQSGLLTLPEWTRLIAIFVDLGIEKIRLTGGEPLLYRELLPLLQSIRSNSRTLDLSITTNGQRLALLAQPLKNVGIGRVNVSLDSLDESRFLQITRGGLLQRTLSGVNEAQQVGLSPVKINCVVMRGVNDDELFDFCEFAREKKVEVRFLEMMPTRFTGGGRELFVSVSEMRDRLTQAGVALEPIPREPGETAERYRVRETGAILGFIGAVTRKFCDSCTRLRILPNGFLKLCLHAESGLNLRNLLRSSELDQEIAETIQSTVWQKPWGSLFDDVKYEKSGTVMSQVGG